jgi:hypothetical protein
LIYKPGAGEQLRLSNSYRAAMLDHADQDDAIAKALRDAYTTSETGEVMPIPSVFSDFGICSICRVEAR